MDVGASLRFLLKDRVVAGIDLAKALGVPPQTVSRWRNYRDMRVSDCRRLADYFGLTIDEFLAYGARDVLED